MVKSSNILNLQLAKDVFHFIFPIALICIMPQGWTTAIIGFIHFVVKSYVYIYIKNPDDLSTIAGIGMLLQAIILTGYVEAL